MTLLTVVMSAFAVDPSPSLTPPASIPSAGVFTEPIRDLMSARTIQAVDRPGMVLLEWGNMGAAPPVGSLVDVWTRRPTGPCTLAQRVGVVLGPNLEGVEARGTVVPADLKHSLPVLSVTRAQVAVLQGAPVAGWTLRSPDDPRDHAEVACK